MRKYVVIILVLFAFSCHRDNDPFIGRWTVEKVNVEFDEYRSTPEMVRQFGELEKGNVIEISKDSVMIFVSDGDTLQGRCSLKGGALYCDGSFFGRYENGIIQTETISPLGKILVRYRKNSN